MNFIYDVWPWYVSGLLIAGVMFLLIFFGKHFGMSSNLRTLCSLGGAGKVADFFRFDWKAQIWGLMVVLGAIIGGFIAQNYLHKPQHTDYDPQTILELQAIGIQTESIGLVPDIFSAEKLSENPKVIIILFIGGLLIGFGTRYAGGCTSGHAISGLSNLQLPSLIAVIGFFIGGLVTSWFIVPFIF